MCTRVSESLCAREHLSVCICMFCACGCMDRHMHLRACVHTCVRTPGCMGSVCACVPERTVRVCVAHVPAATEHSQAVLGYEWGPQSQRGV